MMKFLSEKYVKSFGIAALVGLSVAAEAQQFTWAQSGPIYTAGRVRNMVVDKTDPSGNSLYVGSTSSGVFKSTDGGSNWLPLNDQGTVRNISYMAQTAGGEILAATGEGFLRASQKAKALPGTGLYALTGGSLQLRCGVAATGSVITRLACHSTSAGVVALASEKGILLSANSGSSFQALTVPAGAVGLPGMDVKFDGNGNLWATVGSENSSGTFSATPSMILKGAPPSYNMIDVTPVSGVVTNTLYGRIELGIAPQNNGVIYASVSSKYASSSSATLSGLFVSYDYASSGPTDWGVILVGSGQLDPLSNGGTRASGDYAQNIFVDPNNSDHIMLGSYQLYEFTRTGGTNSSPIGNWTKWGYNFLFNTQLYLHENIHDIKLIGSGISGGKLYFITDAGIYRTIDAGLSFQPFYKGLVTGQFNSVSIERYPLASVPSTPGGSVTPYIGFLGGTGGNGAIYFRGVASGTAVNVNQEEISIGGDVFNTEFSKLLPNAAYITDAAGALYRNTDVTSAEPAQVDLLYNTGNQSTTPFQNSGFNVSGTPYHLWENYGQSYNNQIITPPDSLVFYNDTSAAFATITTLTTSADFKFTIGRPQKKAAIDYVVIRATMVKAPITPSAITITGFSVTNTKTLGIQCGTYTVPNTGTLTVPITTVVGFADATPLVSDSIILNSGTYLDYIHVKLAGPLFTAQPSSAPSTTSMETYVRIKATVYYKYNSGDQLEILDDGISTLGQTYTLNTLQALNWVQPATSTANIASNPVQKFPQYKSARLAVAYSTSGVYVSKTPLDLNAPISLVKISADKALTNYSAGVLYTTTPQPTVNVVGRPTILEWAKSGTELYYATDSNRVYRVSNLFTILDSSSKSYSGKLHTGIFTYSNTPAPPTYTANAFNTPNPRSPYRTTYLGKFPKQKITSLTIASHDSMLMVTLEDTVGAKDQLVYTNGVNIKKCDFTNVNWTNKTGTGLGNITTYCSLLEKDNTKNAFIGTDNGIFYADDITTASPTWSNVNNNQLPNVQIFDIKQQTLPKWACYNSGQIYVATNGRGVWTNNKYYSPTLVGVKEIVESATISNLSIFPNPTTGELNVKFKAFDNEKAVLNIMDINGRLVFSENFGKLYNSDVHYKVDLNELPSGVYIVNVNSDSGIKRVSKLVITK